MASTSNLFGVGLFLLLSVVTGGSSMSISPLVLELWQFLFIRDCPEIRKSEIRPSEFGWRSGDWVEQGIPNAARTSLIKCYWMPQNARVTVFTVSELIREEDGLTDESLSELNLISWRLKLDETSALASFFKFNVNNFSTNSYCRVTCFWWVINLKILFFIFTVDLLVI